MKRLAVWFFVALGLSFGLQDVLAQNTQNADLHPPYLAEEEPVVPEGEEAPVLEEGEGDGVMERGIRRFKFPRIKPKPKIKKGIKVPKFRLRKPRPKEPPPDTLPPKTPPETPPDDPPPVVQCEWKTSDIIDSRIENGDLGDGDTTRGAQTSLMRLMNRGGLAERRAASAMIRAIKEGKLAGIHASFLGRKASVDRAASIPPKGTRGYWTLLPKCTDRGQG